MEPYELTRKRAWRDRGPASPKPRTANIRRWVEIQGAAGPTWTLTSFQNVTTCICWVYLKTSLFLASVRPPVFPCMMCRRVSLLLCLMAISRKKLFPNLKKNDFLRKRCVCFFLFTFKNPTSFSVYSILSDEICTPVNPKIVPAWEKYSKCVSSVPDVVTKIKLKITDLHALSPTHG